jgi:hypothetical protein
MYFFSCAEIQDGWYYKNIGTAEVQYGHKKKLGYRLGVYFGGNQVAPHMVNIEFKKA